MELQQAREQYWDICYKLRAYRYALNLSTWDLATQAPIRGKTAAAKARGILAGQAYELKVSTNLRWVLEVLMSYKDELTQVELRELEILYQDLEKLSKIPKVEYQQFVELQAAAEIMWEAAKERSDYRTLAPYLERLLLFSQRFAILTKPEMHPYDAWLDEYEKNLTRKYLDQFFNAIKEDTIPLLKRITDSRTEIRDDFLYRQYPIEKQERLCRRLLEEIGFHTEAGVFATSEHPFTKSTIMGDVRLTTHYYENNLSAGLFSALHEGGHGIYEQNAGMSPIVGGTMLDDASAMSIQESQARFYENFIGRSKPFCEAVFPELKSVFPDQLSDVTADEFYRAVNIVKPGPSRILADELSYNLHVMIRYELEKDLMEQNISVRQLPERWNEKYEEYLGCLPDSDKMGVLQDIHWSGGLFGYFPSYSLGNAIAAQLLNTMNKSMDLDSLCRNGNFAPITEWLCVNIHQYGNLTLPSPLVEHVTGEIINPRYLTAYLENKFNSVYFS